MRIKITHPTHPDVLGNEARSPDGEPHFTAFRSWRRRLGYFSILTALPAVLGWYLSEAKASEPISSTVPVPAAGETEHRQVRAVKSYSKPELLQAQANFLLPHQKEKLDLAASFTANGDDCPGIPVPIGTYTTGATFSDSRDTTGANNTINTYPQVCYVSSCDPPIGDVKGPDLVYTFTITSKGTAPEIRVTPNSAAYDPAVHVLAGGWSGCPAGTGHNLASGLVLAFSNDAGPGGAEVISGEKMNLLPLNTRLYLFVDAVAPNHGGPYTLRMQDVSVTSGPASFDFDRDDRSDFTVYRPTVGVWYRDIGDEMPAAVQFGLPTDRIVPADYDGDRKTDYAIYRDGVWWWIASSSNTVYAAQFGLAGDTPVPADYTGDGRAELAVYRDGVWWTLDLANGQVGINQFGLTTDKPVPGDYDGDGLTDRAVFRDGIWYLDRSSQGFAALQWGLPGDQIVPADYDGDGRIDPAVYRNGVWYLLQSSLGSTFFQWGLPGDIPVSADYNGDGKADTSLFRNGVWYVRSTWGDQTYPFGAVFDVPVPSAYNR